LAALTSSNDDATINDGLNLWEKPNAISKKEWLSKHPIQPKSSTQFNVHKVFMQQVGAEQIQRHWISYNSNTIKKVNCYICLAYSSDQNSPFVSNGLSTADVKHLYSRISEHEKSEAHDSSVCAYIMGEKSPILPSHLTTTMAKLHDDAILINRHIMYCVIKAVIFLGKMVFLSGIW
jgi:hypothetical protein